MINYNKMLKNFSNPSYFFKNKSKHLSAALFSAFLLTKPAKAPLKDHIYTCEDRSSKDIYHAHYMDINLDDFFKSPESQQKKEKFVKTMITKAHENKNKLIKKIEQKIGSLFFNRENNLEEDLKKSTVTPSFAHKVFLNLISDYNHNQQQILKINFTQENMADILKNKIRDLGLFKYIKEFLFPNHDNFDEFHRELQQIIINFQNCVPEFLKNIISKNKKEVDIKCNIESNIKKFTELLQNLSKEVEEFYESMLSIQYILLKKELKNISKFIVKSKSNIKVKNKDNQEVELSLTEDNLKTLKASFGIILKNLKPKTIKNEKGIGDIKNITQLFKKALELNNNIDKSLDDIKGIKRMDGGRLWIAKNFLNEKLFLEFVKLNDISNVKQKNNFPNLGDNFLKNVKDDVNNIEILKQRLSTKVVEKGEERGLKQDIDYFFDNFCKDIHITISYEEQKFCSDDLLDTFKRFVKEFVNRPTNDFCKYKIFNTFLVLKFKTVFLKTLKDKKGNFLYDDQGNPKTEVITFVDQNGETQKAIPHISLERCMPVFKDKKELKNFFKKDYDIMVDSNDKTFLKLIYKEFKDVLDKLERTIKDELLSLHLKTTLLDELKEPIEKFSNHFGGVANQGAPLEFPSAKKLEKSYFDLKTQLDTAINNMEKEINENTIEKIKLYDVRYNMDILKEDNENNQQIEEDNNIESTDKMKQDIEKIKTKIKSKDDEIKRLEEKKCEHNKKIEELSEFADKKKYLTENLKPISEEIKILKSKKQQLELKMKEIEDIEKEIKQKKEEKIEKIKDDNLHILKFFEVIADIKKNEENEKNENILNILKALKEKIEKIKKDNEIFNIIQINAQTLQEMKKSEAYFNYIKSMENMIDEKINLLK